MKQLKLNLESSVNSMGDKVTQIIHFSGGSKKTIKGIKTDTIQQGQFTQFETTNGRLIFINDKNVDMFEVFKEDGKE